MSPMQGLTLKKPCDGYKDVGVGFLSFYMQVVKSKKGE